MSDMSQMPQEMEGRLPVLTPDMSEAAQAAVPAPSP